MKASRMKKFVAVALAFAMVLPLSAPVFAAETPSTTESRVNNRYYFTTEPGTRHFVYSHVKTWEDLQTEEAYDNAVDAFIAALTGKLPSSDYKVSSSFVLNSFADMLNAMHGIGSKGKVEIYSRLDTRYRVDSITGTKTRVGYTYVLEYLIYVDNGKGYTLINTRECSRNGK